MVVRKRIFQWVRNVNLIGRQQMNTEFSKRPLKARSRGNMTLLNLLLLCVSTTSQSSGKVDFSSTIPFETEKICGSEKE
jgi:hypothetical protein